jgi:hypothetical protein
LISVDSPIFGWKEELQLWRDKYLIADRHDSRPRWHQLQLYARAIHLCDRLCLWEWFLMSIC